MSSNTPNFDKLTSNNYPTWADEMEAWFRSAGLWRVVSGSSTRPTCSNKPTTEEEAAIDAWELKSDKAAGQLFLMVEQAQRVHFNGIKDDPVKMWAALCSVHMQQCAGTRFNAYDDLFSIRKQEDESLQSLINRVDSAMHTIRDLRPSSFTLDKLDNELASMALIPALPEEYNSFVSSLLLKDNLDKAAVQEAFATEGNQRRRRAEQPAVGTAFATSSSSSKCCGFCGTEGHGIDDCNTYKRGLEYAKAKRAGKKSKQKANNVEAPKESPSEFAGNTSASSTSSSTPSNFDWLADTGATSHMTPHRHWVRNYMPLRGAIKLADNSTVYSAGVGTVVFSPSY